MISTFHINDTMEKRRRTKAVTEGVATVQKPGMIDGYNLYMRSVGKSDQLVLYQCSLILKVVEERILSFT